MCEDGRVGEDVCFEIHTILQQKKKSYLILQRKNLSTRARITEYKVEKLQGAVKLGKTFFYYLGYMPYLEIETKLEFQVFPILNRRACDTSRQF